MIYNLVKMRNIVVLFIIALIVGACEKEEGQLYNLCDVLSQPVSIVHDSIELITFDVFTPSGDGYNDMFEIWGCKTSNEVYPLSHIFTDIVLTVYNNSVNDPAYEIEHPQPYWHGTDANGNYFGDGVYRYELLLDDTVITRLIGIYSTHTCPDDFNCSDPLRDHLSDQIDPLFHCND